MDNLLKRQILFLLACIGVRSLIVYLAKIASPYWLSTMGYIALLPAFGFIIIYLFGLRKTGREVFGKKIWWNHLRPLHAFLYILFAYYAINKEICIAWQFLAIDVIIGLVCFLYKHNFLYLQ
jgi:hypothetical protein